MLQEALAKKSILIDRDAELLKELRTYLDTLVINGDTIGDIRRGLFVPWDSQWNGQVRTETASRERPAPPNPFPLHFESRSPDGDGQDAVGVVRQTSPLPRICHDKRAAGSEPADSHQFHVQEPATDPFREWLSSRAFYDLMQTYRHAWGPSDTDDAFDAVKAAIRAAKVQEPAADHPQEKEDNPTRVDTPGSPVDSLTASIGLDSLKRCPRCRSADIILWDVNGWPWKCCACDDRFLKPFLYSEFYAKSTAAPRPPIRDCTCGAGAPCNCGLEQARAALLKVLVPLPAPPGAASPQSQENKEDASRVAPLNAGADRQDLPQSDALAQSPLPSRRNER